MAGRVGDRAGILIGLTLLAAVPVAVGTLHGLTHHWYLVGDRAVVAVRAFDVLSSHPPLVGQYSLASQLSGAPTYSPGPLLFWLLAAPAHAGPRALMLTVALLNAACSAGCVLIAHRRGGLGFALAATAALLLLWRSLPAEAPFDLLNPYAALLPMALFLLCAWDVAGGRAQLLPLLALTGSFVVQSHLAYLAVGAGTAALAVAGLAGARPSGIRRSVVAAVVVLAICWAAPIAEQLTHRPGNLVLISRTISADREEQGLRQGWNALVRTVGVPPWWLRERRSTLERVIDVGASPSRAQAASAVAVLAGLALALAAGLRRRRRDLATGTAIALWLCFAVVALVAATPVGELGLTLDLYGLYWASVAGMFTWLVLGWSLWTLLAPGPLRLPARSLAPAGAAVLAVALAWTLADREEDPAAALYGQTATVANAVAAAAPPAGVVCMRLNGTITTNDFHPVIAYALRRHGLDVEAPPRYAALFGSHYMPSRRGCRLVIAVREGDPPTPASQRLLVRVPGRATITARPGP